MAFKPSHFLIPILHEHTFTNRLLYSCDPLQLAFMSRLCCCLDFVRALSFSSKNLLMRPRSVAKICSHSLLNINVSRINCYSCYTVVSEKKGTFICELILEQNIYLRNTQKQLQITNYVRNKSLSEFYLVYNGACLKLLGSLL